MVKLDLEINEIIGLAELGKIDKKRLLKFLKAATKEELEKYLVDSTFENEDQKADDKEEPKETDDDDDLDIDIDDS